MALTAVTAVETQFCFFLKMSLESLALCSEWFDRSGPLIPVFLKSDIH